MNCSEYQDWLQDHLDGTGDAGESQAEEHRAGCPDCAGLGEALVRLSTGLRLLEAPAPPPHLAKLIVRGVLADRRSLQRRRFAMVAASIAASLVLAFLLGRFRPADTTTPETSNIARNIPEPPPPAVPERPRLNESVDQAGSALAALVSRTADQTVGQGRLLLPNPMSAPEVAADPWPMLETPPSLVAAGQSVGAGLEPVTSEARRAVTLFLRDIPPVATGLQ